LALDVHLLKCRHLDLRPFCVDILSVGHQIIMLHSLSGVAW